MLCYWWLKYYCCFVVPVFVNIKPAWESQTKCVPCDFGLLNCVVSFLRYLLSMKHCKNECLVSDVMPKFLSQFVSHFECHIHHFCLNFCHTSSHTLCPFVTHCNLYKFTYKVSHFMSHLLSWSHIFVTLYCFNSYTLSHTFVQALFSEVFRRLLAYLKQVMF